jgi:UTP-glucose-1-phosphate uridylyltransferase
MNAKIIQTGDTIAFVVKKDSDIGLSPFHIEVLFVIEGELVTVNDHFKTENERDIYFEETNERKVLEHIDHLIR